MGELSKWARKNRAHFDFVEVINFNLKLKLPSFSQVELGSFNSKNQEGREASFQST